MIQHIIIINIYIHHQYRAVGNWYTNFRFNSRGATREIALNEIAKSSAI